MPKKPETKTKEEREYERVRRKAYIKNIKGITKSDIRRISRRSGVKRISKKVDNDIRDIVHLILDDIVRDSVIYSCHAKRKTVTTKDVKRAFKRQGRTIYGK